MFHRELWFAWFPVSVRTKMGQRVAWLETVMRECIVTKSGSGKWRYYAQN